MEKQHGQASPKRLDYTSPAPVRRPEQNDGKHEYKGVCKHDAIPAKGNCLHSGTTRTLCINIELPTII
eukprot:2039078-Amphidinium_carterae.1